MKIVLKSFFFVLLANGKYLASIQVSQAASQSGPAELRESTTERRD